MKCGLPVAVLLFATSFGSLGGDWPQWRGPFCSGGAVDSPDKPASTATNLVQLWESEARLPGTYEADARFSVKLTRNLTSSGYSSPIVAGGCVYVYYYVPNGDVFDKAAHRRHVDRGMKTATAGRKALYPSANEVILCVDAANGKTLWKRTFVAVGLNLEGGFNKGGGNFTMCYADGKVYAIGTSAKVYCLEAKTGKPVWENDLGIRRRYMKDLVEHLTEIESLTGARNDFGGNPLVIGGVLTVSDHIEYKGGPRNMKGNGLIGLDAGTGEFRWVRTGFGGSGMLAGTPLCWTHKGKEYVIGSGGRGIGCIDPRDGKLLWTAKGGFQNAAAILGDLLVVAGENVSCFELSLSGAKAKWEAPGGFRQSSPAIYKGCLLYSAGGEIRCARMSDGRLQGALKGAGAPEYSSLVAGDGFLFVPTAGRGKAGLSVLSAEPSGGALKKVGSWRISYANSTTPAYADGKLYVRSEDRLRCFVMGKRQRENR